MKILVERSHLNEKFASWIRVKVSNSDDIPGCPVTLFKYRYTGEVSEVGYYTANFNYKTKLFNDYEEAWRFMWRKAMKWS